MSILNQSALHTSSVRQGTRTIPVTVITQRRFHLVPGIARNSPFYQSVLPVTCVSCVKLPFWLPSRFCHGFSITRNIAVVRTGCIEKWIYIYKSWSAQTLTSAEDDYLFVIDYSPVPFCHNPLRVTAIPDVQTHHGVRAVIAHLFQRGCC